jgi:hypothetical protein
VRIHIHTCLCLYLHNAADRLLKTPAHVQEILRLAAAINTRFSASLLALVCKTLSPVAQSMHFLFFFFSWLLLLWL